MAKIMTIKHYFSPFSWSSEATPSDAILCTPWILSQMKGLIKLYNPSKFPEDSICSSHFRDYQKIKCQKQSFLTCFGWFLINWFPKRDPICRKLLPVILHQGNNTSHMLWFLILMQYQNLLKLSPILLKFSPEIVFQLIKTVFEFLRKRDRPKVCFFVPTLTLCFSLKMSKIKKSNKKLRKKFSHLVIQICQSLQLISSPFQMKNWITFCPFWAFWGKNKVGSKVKGSESKI